MSTALIPVKAEEPVALALLYVREKHIVYAPSSDLGRSLGFPSYKQISAGFDSLMKKVSEDIVS